MAGNGCRTVITRVIDTYNRRGTSFFGPQIAAPFAASVITSFSGGCTAPFVVAAVPARGGGPCRAADPPRAPTP